MIKLWINLIINRLQVYNLCLFTNHPDLLDLINNFSVYKYAKHNYFVLKEL